MNNLITVLILLAPARILSALPSAKIVEEVNERTENGYRFRYLTSDLQEREESGQLVEEMGQKFFRVEGFYSFVVDGKKHTVIYSADENGYLAKEEVGVGAINGIEAGKPEIEPAVPSTFQIGSSAIATLVGGGLG